MVSDEVVGDVFCVEDEFFGVEELFGCAADFVNDSELEVDKHGADWRHTSPSRTN